jgi:hypothetical protein
MPETGKFTNQILQAKKRKVQLVLLSLFILSFFTLGVYYGKAQIEMFFLGLSGFHPLLVQAESATYASHSDIQVLNETISSKVDYIDPRAYVLDEYFKANGSPLYGTGKIFVDACERYGAPGDCVTVAAIARNETDLCKYHTSAQYYNCWGFGGGGNDRITFSSWEESINLVTDRLANSYGYKYMLDPSLMERTFCGPDPACIGWGTRIKYFMSEIDQYPLSLGFDKPMSAYR